MTLYNILSCRGFIEENAKLTMDFGPCAQARLILVGLFFINAFVRKWFGEEMDIDYNFWLGMGGSFVGYLIPLTISGNVGLSFVIGLISMLVCGYGAGVFLGGSEDGY